MPSNFESSYTKLKAYLPKIKKDLDSINDEIDKILTATTSENITESRSLVARALRNAQSTNEDYRHTFETVVKKIANMDNADGKKEEEQQKLEEFTNSTDATTEMEVDPVSISFEISKIESVFLRSIETAMACIRTESRYSPSSSENSSGDSNPLPSTAFHGVPISALSLNSTNVDLLSAKLLELEARISDKKPIHQPNLVLPQIKLESFDGTDLTRWPAYKYQLDMLILNQDHLNEVEKAYYVRSSLKGNALSLISTIPTNKDFLSKIIDRLELEYSRPNLTQATLLQSLLRMRAKSPKLDDQLETVRAMINVVHSIDEKCGLNGLVTQQQIADRIHERFIPIIWRRNFPTLLESLQHIEETLRTELEDVTMINAISDRRYRSNNNGTPSHTSNNNKSPPHPAVVGSSSPSNKGPKIPKCVFCSRHDYSGECEVVKNPKDRKEFLRKNSLCFCCFSKHHSTADCNKKCINCAGKHHKSLCERPSKATFQQSVVVSNQQPERLFTATATVANPDPASNSSTVAHIHLDHGAQVTLISRALVNRLSLVPFDTRDMSIAGINGDPSIVSPHDIVKLDVVTDRGKIQLEAVVREGSSVNTIYTDPLPDEDLDVVQATLGTVPDHFSEPSVVHSDLLLSVGDSLELLDSAKQTKLPCGYHLVQSSIGPIVVGSNRTRTRTFDPVVSALTVNVEESLEEKIERLFSVDPAARVYDTTEKEARKVANELVNQHFEDTVVKKGNEYFVQYSIKPEARTSLPSNYDLAVSRLNSTVKTLSKQRSNLEFYNSIIQDQLSLEQIEMVDPRDTDGIIHYLAHQPVLRPDKPTTPLRIVYDASAHLRNKPSLNDMIYPGPSDLEQIPSILLRARSRRSLIVSDVEKAFLQVRLHPSQRNMLRFLWIKDIDKPVTLQNILVLRFCVTPFGVNASPALLKKVIHHHIRLNEQNCDQQLIHQLISNLYVDNVIINVDLPLSNMYTESKSLFETMSMNLRDYASNDASFMNMIPESDRSKDDIQKLLGLLWKISSDKLSMNIPISDKSGKVTKRTMLSSVCSPFDPLGLLNPLTLPPRLTIQKLWNTTLKWDDPVGEDVKKEFHVQMNELEDFHLSIDRYAHLSDCDEITLIAFSDASKHAMAACIYNVSANASPILLISKTRLAPIKCKSTIPKMELDSLVMAHSLSRFTVEALRKEFPSKPIHVFFYSDSACVLHWCKPEFTKPLGIFVANRVKKIRETRDELTSFQPLTYNEPRHVRSECNPADHATRGLTSKDMNNPSHQWWTGPEWLKSDPDSWPNEDLSSLQCPSIDVFPMAICTVTMKPSIETVIDLSRFSSLRKAIGVTARVFRFLSRCASKVKNLSVQEKLKHLPDSSLSRTLSSTERRFAFNSLIRLHQTKYISSNDQAVKKNLILEDQSTRVWKANTRLTNSNLSSDTKSPVFIPTSTDSILAKLIISDIHKSSSHSNVDVILNQVKRKYWIPRCRQIAKSVLKQCVPCRKTNNLPFSYPKSPPLPSGRVRPSLPFNHCGIDYAGPFHSNRDEKMYVIVFTCFSTRLSHLEIVDSLLPSSFIFAFRRFCSRRSTPSHITSDKATTFRMASTLLSKPETDQDVMNTLISTLGVQWSFTTAHSPWKGGIYERLVKIIKESLSRTIGKKKLSIEEFTTVICEIEALLNSRPLTYVSSDDVHSFNGPVLRPIDLISPESFLGCSVILSEIDDDYRPPYEENSSREAAISQLKRSIEVVDLFWKRWQSEYLTTLRDSSKSSDPLHSTRSTPYPPTPGSLVLVVDESGNTPRSSWRMAKILSLTDSSATLKSHAGRIIERPLNLLIPLEIHSNEDSTAMPIPALFDSLNLPLTPSDDKEADKEDIPKPIKESKSTTSTKTKSVIPLRAEKKITEHVTNVANDIVYTIHENLQSVVSELHLKIDSISDSLVDLTSKVDNLINNVSLITTAPPVVTPIVAPTPQNIPSIIPHFNAVKKNHSTSSNTPSTSHSFPNRSSFHRSRSPVTAHRYQHAHSQSTAFVRSRERSRSRSPMRRNNAVKNSTFHCNVPQCAFCQSDEHFSKHCNIVTSLSTRTAILRNSNRCMKCFRVMNGFHRKDCEPNLCMNGCRTPQGVPERHCNWLCPANPNLQP